MAVRKWSISIDEEIAEKAEKAAGKGGLSRFVARAVASELERTRLHQYLAEMEEEFGPIDQAEVDEFNELWPS